MINASETPIENASHVFSSITSGVLNCLGNNRRSIGYMDADQVVSFNPGGANAGLAYVVRVDGADDPSLAGPKRDLKCGRYVFWTGWRLNRRTTSEGLNIDALAQTFVDNASAPATIAILPTGAYWASNEEVFVSKKSDKGPLISGAGAHPKCR